MPDPITSDQSANDDQFLKKLDFFTTQSFTFFQSYWKRFARISCSVFRYDFLDFVQSEKWRNF